MTFNPDKLAREWAREHIMTLRWPSLESPEPEGVVPSLSALLRRVRDEAMEEAAGIAEGVRVNVGPDGSPNVDQATTVLTVACAIRARGKDV